MTLKEKIQQFKDDADLVKKWVFGADDEMVTATVPTLAKLIKDKFNKGDKGDSITSVDINTDGDLIIDIENQSSQNAGRVLFKSKGTHLEGNTYDKYDLVTSDGSSYFAKQDVPASTEITNTDYWQLFAQKGDTGTVSNHNHDSDYANITGSTSNRFKVADATTDDEAVNLSQLNSKETFDYKENSNPAKTTNPANVGATWINKITGEIFVCINNTTDNNIWTGSNDSKVGSNTWTTMANMPTVRGNLTSSVVGTDIYVIGGYDGSSFLPTNEKYNTLIDAWTTMANMPTARSSLTSSVVGTDIYVIGGYNGNRLNTNEKYAA